jgi:uncharacterized membrane protein
MKDNTYVIKGIGLMVLSACLVTVGQFLWKISDGNLLYILAGLMVYGLGAVVMLLAFRCGELSVLHPVLSVSYIFSLIIGAVYLNEPVSLTKITGILVIFIGLVFLGLSSKVKKDD